MRYIVFLLTCIIGAIISLPMMLFFKIIKKEKEFNKYFLRPFFGFMLKILNVKINIHGDIDRTFSHTMVVANHTSLFDIVLLTSQIRSRMIYVSKKENTKIPVISWWMMMNETIFIDRDNLKQSLKKMSKASEYLLEGENIMIFPQGTRDVENINFKSGTLRFAQKGEADIWPIAIKGPNKIFEGLGYKRKEIDLYLFDVIKYEDYKDENIKEVQANIESMIGDKVIDG